ncbi:MAG: hypothetical protein M3362_10250 [Acidobacteriota bacterium]|nr:hypothetical protein [Acidobacteriota bacterium]
MRIFAGLVMITVGTFALYTIIAKPKHSLSSEPFDQAIGIPKIVTRIIRGGIGLFFIALGVIAILKAVQLIP